jgi:hypothetical protein
MNILTAMMIVPVGAVIDQVSMFLSSLPGLDVALGAGSGVTLSFALAASAIPESVFATVRRWHGGIDDQFSNIDNLVTLIVSHQLGDTGRFALSADLQPGSVTVVS